MFKKKLCKTSSFVSDRIASLDLKLLAKSERNTHLFFCAHGTMRWNLFRLINSYIISVVGENISRPFTFWSIGGGRREKE